MGIDGNEIAGELVKEVLVISADIGRWVIRDWTSRSHEEDWHFVRWQRQVRGFPENPLWEKGEKLLTVRRNQLRIMRVANRTLSYERTFI
jgi:hypothetical protein